MASLFEKPRKIDGQGGSAHPLPTTCGVKGCHNACGVLLAIVTDAHGKERIGTCGQFGKGTSQGFVPAPGFEWRGFIARCALHYRNDLYRAGKGQLSEFPGMRELIMLQTDEREPSAEDAPW